MVFSRLLNNLTGLVSNGSNKDQQYNNNDVLINELHQGMKLLNGRKNKINKMKGRMKLVENLSGFVKGNETLQKTSENEIQILKDLDKTFEYQLKDYKITYNKFMTDYYTAVSNVKQCKATCITSIPKSGSDWSNTRAACQTGCDLKGPYVQKCENTYKGAVRFGGKDCDEVASGRCSDGIVNPGSNDDVTGSDYADSNNITIKAGCCKCGGGAGGPPSNVMMGTKITSCEQIPKAYKFSGDQGAYMETACHNARVTNSEKNADLFSEYSKLTDKNGQLIITATNIFDKINKLSHQVSKIGTSMSEQDEAFKKELTDYRTIYADIISRQGKTDGTTDAQLEDIIYKEDSGELRLWIWSGLAILTILFAIQKMRK
jgi:hypothetical protein